MFVVSVVAANFFANFPQITHFWMYAKDLSSDLRYEKCPSLPTLLAGSGLLSIEQVLAARLTCDNPSL